MARSDAGGYDFPIDLANLNSVPGRLAQHVPQGSRILDLGCASGKFSAAMVRERGCKVVGVEIDPLAAAAARESGLEVIEADLDQSSLATLTSERHFDRVLLADVLEHLAAPEALLRAAAERVACAGRLLLSIPNISHVDVLLALATDRWQYTDSGLLDRTHIRFFTEHSIRQLVDSAGCRVETIHRLRLPAFATEIWRDAPPPNPALQTLAEQLARLNPNADVYQYVSVLVPRRGSPLRRVLRAPLAATRRAR